MTTREIFIPPSPDFIQYLITEEFDVPIEVFNVAVDEFKLVDNHTFLIDEDEEDMPRGKITTKSKIEMTVDIRDGGYINSNPEFLVTQDENGDFSTECFVTRDEDEKRRFIARIAELKKLSLPLQDAPLGVIQTLMEFLPGKDVLALCQISKKVAKFCNSKEVGDIFRKLIIAKDKKYEQYIIPGREREYYIKILHGLDDFWERHISSTINWENLYDNPNLSLSFFKRHKDMIIADEGEYKLGFLSGNSSLGEDFWKDHFDEIDWNRIVRNTSMSEKFFERYIYMIIDSDSDSDTRGRIATLCKRKDFSEEFLEKRIKRNQVVWYELSRNSSLSQAFFERHLDKVDWRWLSTNSSLSEDFIEKYLDNFDWHGLSENEGLSESFFERHLDQVVWESLCQNTNMSEEFFERHLQEIDWDQILKNPSLSEEFFERHMAQFSDGGYQISRNEGLSEAFFERHMDMDIVNWDLLCENSNMSPEFFERHPKYVHWPTLAGNPMTIKL